MIVIELWGGLGNQLFQILAGLQLSLERDMEYRMYDKFYHKTPKGCTKRSTYWNTFLCEFKDKVVDKDFDLTKYTKYKGLPARGYRSPPPANTSHILLHGYFQSYKYFEKRYEDVLKILNIRDKQKAALNKYNQDYDNMCSIHFRYGDYKAKQKYHINLDASYYKKAVSHIKSKKYLLFYEKEDRNLVDKVINNIREEGVEYIYIDTDIPDYEQMMIMSLCKDNIIGNSTFSWLAAYFNSNKNKRIVQPSRVVHNERDLGEQSPNNPSWITIKV